METGKNTISDPAMANQVDHSQADANHPRLKEIHTKQPSWWEKKKLCRGGRSKFKPTCKDACWAFNNHHDARGILDYILNGF